MVLASATNDNKVRRKLFRLFKHINSSQNVSHKLFMLLLFIEALQVYYFTIYRKFEYAWNSEYTKLARSIIKYTHVYPVSEQDGPTPSAEAYLLIFGLLNSYLLIVFILLLACYLLIYFSHGQMELKVHPVLQLIYKIINTSALLFSSVGVVPFLQINIFFLLSDQVTGSIYGDLQFSVGTKFACIFIALAALIIFMIFNYLYNLFNIEPNPFQETINAQTINSVTILFSFSSETRLP